MFCHAGGRYLLLCHAAEAWQIDCWIVDGGDDDDEDDGVGWGEDGSNADAGAMAWMMAVGP